LDKLRRDADRNCCTHGAASGRRQRRRTRHGIAPIPSHRLTITRGLRVSRATVAGRIVWHRCSHSQGDSAVRSCALRIILVSTLLQEFILVPSSLQLTKSLCPSWIVSEPLRQKKHGDREKYAQWVPNTCVNRGSCSSTPTLVSTNFPVGPNLPKARNFSTCHPLLPSGSIVSFR
jgi:hypothetical protein